MAKTQLAASTVETGNFLGRVLGERHVIKTVVAEYHENFDEVMSAGTTERPWQSFELTQAENVIEWIEDPRRIAKIQPSLEDLVLFTRSLNRPFSILDVGCYGGYLYDYLTRVAGYGADDFSYFGVDINEDVVAAANIAHGQKVNVNFERGDVYNLAGAFGENAFDIVFCSRVLIHIPKFRDALAQLYAVSKSHALSVLEISPQPKLQRIHRKNTDNGVELDYFFRKYSEQELKSVADDLGANFRFIRGSSFYSSFVLSKQR